MKRRAKFSLTISAALLGAAFTVSGCAGSTHPTLPPLIEEEQTTIPPETETPFEQETTSLPTEDSSAENDAAADDPSIAEAVAAVMAAPDSVIDLSTTLYTYDKMASDLSLLAAAYPQYMTLDTIGTTADGRSLYVVYFGNREASRQIMICAATHAREYMTSQLVMKQLEYYCAHYADGSYNSIPYAQLFENTCFAIVPMVNPDGVCISQFGENGLNRQDLRDNLHSIYSSDQVGAFTSENDFDTYLTHWKANAMGVDLNRNYSPGWETVTDRPVPSFGLFRGEAPGSEAESSALMALIESLSNPVMAISYHSYGELVYWQYGQPEPLWTQNSELAARICELTGYASGEYSNEAGFSNWCVNVKGIPSVTVETGSVPTPLPLEQFDPIWQKNRDMWAMLAAL